MNLIPLLKQLADKNRTMFKCNMSSVQLVKLFSIKALR